MDTNTLPSVASRKHRLFLVVPLFALCAGVCVLDGFARVWESKMHADVLVVSEESGTQDVIVHNGAARITDGTQLINSGSDLFLQKGSATFLARGLLSVHAQDITVMAFQGGFRLDASEKSLTVAALTAPVVLHQGDAVIFVPALTQRTVADALPSFHVVTPAEWYEARVPLALPEHYVREYVPVVRALEKQQENGPALKRCGNFAFFDRAVRFVVAEKEARNAEVECKLAEMEAALLQNDEATLAALLSSAPLQTAMADPGHLTTVAHLLAVSSQQGRSPLLLPLVKDQRELWLALSFHPQWQHALWALPIPSGISEEERLLRVLLTPVADMVGEGMPALSLRGWAMEYHALVAAAPDPEMLQEATYPLLLRSIVQLQERGFPERAQKYAAALLEGMDPASDRATTLRALAAGENVPLSLRIREVEVPALRTAVQDAVLASAAFSSVPSFDAEASLAGVREMLMGKGCMLTVKTEMRALAADRIEVRNVVFGTPTGDRLLQFSIDPLTGMVFDILQDGKTLPFSLPLEKYLSWVRGE